MKIWRRTALIAAELLTLAAIIPPLSAQQQNEHQQDADGCTLRIHVDGLRDSKGVVGTVLFKSPAGWPENIHKAYRTGPTPIAQDARDATVVWNNLPSGDYAVAAIHDENKNAHLDRNMIGIPKEGFGFANNPRIMLSAPAFNAAKVHVTCPVTETDIHLQYR